MKHKWDVRFYLDLYAGAGYNKIRGTSRIVLGSPLLAISVERPFDKYIFCEEDLEKLDALRQRTHRIAPSANVAYVSGDCNSRVKEILREIPPASRQSTVLGLCLVDPYDLGIKFETLRALSERYVDFLCLLALNMDARRNYQRYIEPESKKVNESLGSSDWRGGQKRSLEGLSSQSF
jgi:three-Cys-motif partner protein